MHGVNFSQMPPEGPAAAHLNPPDLVHALRGLLQRGVARGLLGVLGREVRERLAMLALIPIPSASRRSWRGGRATSDACASGCARSGPSSRPPGPAWYHTPPCDPPVRVSAFCGREGEEKQFHSSFIPRDRLIYRDIIGGDGNVMRTDPHQKRKDERGLTRMAFLSCSASALSWSSSFISAKCVDWRGGVDSVGRVTCVTQGHPTHPLSL